MRRPGPHDVRVEMWRPGPGSTTRPRRSARDPQVLVRRASWRRFSASTQSALRYPSDRSRSYPHPARPIGDGRPSEPLGTAQRRRASRHMSALPPRTAHQPAWWHHRLRHHQVRRRRRSPPRARGRRSAAPPARPRPCRTRRARQRAIVGGNIIHCRPSPAAPRQTHTPPGRLRADVRPAASGSRRRRTGPYRFGSIFGDPVRPGAQVRRNTRPRRSNSRRQRAVEAPAGRPQSSPRVSSTTEPPVGLPAGRGLLNVSRTAAPARGRASRRP